MKLDWTNVLVYAAILLYLAAFWWFVWWIVS